MRLIPHRYQLEAAKFLLDHPFAALIADPGLGKTAIMLMLIHELKRKGHLPPTLITTTLRIATDVWPEEIKQWDQFQGLSCRVIRGPKRDQLIEEPADIHVTNNESLQWFHNNGHLARYKMIIVDESSKFKNWSSKRFKILKKALPGFCRRYILTGSPTPHSLLDIFAQMYIVDRGETLGNAVTSFKYRLFREQPGSGKWVPKHGAEQYIYKKISPYCYRLDAATHLDMPPLTINDIKVSLPKKAAASARDAVLSIDLTSRINSSTDRMWARRAASGIDDDGTVLHDAKLTAVRDLVDELQGKPVIIFFYFRAEGEMLAKMFDAPMIRGGVSSKESSRLTKAWNAGELPVLLMQPAATGHGLNLQRGGNDIIWFSLTDNQDDYYQAIRRVWRQGVKGSVRVHRILAKASIDIAMAASLEDKANSQEALKKAIGALQESLRHESESASGQLVRFA